MNSKKKAGSTGLRLLTAAWSFPRQSVLNPVTVLRSRSASLNPITSMERIGEEFASI
jgi:hypothetical protein